MRINGGAKPGKMEVINIKIKNVSFHEGQYVYKITFDSLFDVRLSSKLSDL